MADAPKKIWVCTTDVEPHSAGQAHISITLDGDATEYTRTDVALAMVAAEREACAMICQEYSMDHGRGMFDEHSDECAKRIRARTDADAQAALECVKREAWQQGYETGTGEITAAIEPAPDSVREAGWNELVSDGIAEAEKAMAKFPQPNYVISKVAEEAGEVVKAAIHCAEGRETPENVRAEMKQLIAMLHRLWIEGDQVHGLRALMEDTPND